MPNPFSQFEVKPEDTSPSQEDNVNPFEQFNTNKESSTPSSTTATGAFVKGAVRSTLPSVAGLAAFPAGASAGAAIVAPIAKYAGKFAPIVEGLGAIGGGLAASLGVGEVTSKAQEAVADSIPFKLKHSVGMDESTMAKEGREHPFAQFAGQLSPNLLSFRPGSLETVKMAGREIGPWAQRSILAGAGAGMEAAQEHHAGEAYDPTKIAMSAIFQGVAAKPTRFGEKLMASIPVKKSQVVDPGSDEWTTRDLRENYQLPKELNGVPVREGKVKEGPPPEAIQQTAFRNKETGEIIPSGPKHNEDLKNAVVPLEQGFLLQNGKFVNRFEAAKHAYQHHNDSLVKDIDFQGTSQTGAMKREVELTDTVPPKTLYHGTNKDTSTWIDADGNLHMKPSKNFGGKTSSVSFTHDPNIAADYAARVKGGGPDNFNLQNTKLIEIDSDALNDVSRESGEEWAVNSHDPVVIPKGKFKINKLPGHDITEEHPDYSFNEYLKDYGYNVMEREDIHGDPEVAREKFLEYQAQMREDIPEFNSLHTRADRIKSKLSSVAKSREAGTYKSPEVLFKAEGTYREPGLHSTDFGELGTDALKTFNKDATRPDGSPVLARHYRDADGNSSHIIIDKDAIIEDFKNKPWMNPKEPGVNPLPADLIKTPGDLVQFYALHEKAHTTVQRPSFVSIADHENLVNELAMEEFNRTNEGRSTPDAGVPAIPTTIEELANSLFTFGKIKEFDNVLSSQRLTSAEKEGVDLSMMDRWQKFAEGDPKVSLQGKDLELFNKYYAREAAEIKALVQKAIDEGWINHLEMDPEVIGGHAPRETIKPEMSKWESLKKNLADPGKGGFDQNIERVPGAATERGYFSLEFPNGKRTLVQSRGDATYQIIDGKSYKIHPEGNIKAGDKIGTGIVKEARIAEIEKHTPVRYNKNSQAVLYKRLTEMREFVRAHEFLKDMVESEYFKGTKDTPGVGVKLEDGKSPPDGYQVLKNTEKVPQLRGYAFKPRVAEIIDDFSKVWSPNAMTLMSGALVKNMMLNPLPHMLNEAWHVYNARGITGWVTPAGIGRFIRTGIPAIRQVMTQGAEYRSMLLDGASLLSADVRSSAIQSEMMKRGTKEFINTPEAASLAKEYGISLGELYNKISSKSSIAMWSVRDAMYMQLIKEKMMYENMTQKEAITEVERHLPNYRIAARVGEKVLGGTLSRGLSQVLQNPNVSVFSRYHYGMVNSLIETAKDIGAIRQGKAGLKQFGHGVDTAVAMAVAMSVLYPLQDMIAAKLTGNEHAEQRRAGPFHVFDAIQKVIEGKKDAQAILAAIFTFNPMLLMAGQATFNVKLYNGQKVYNPGSVAPDLEKYFAGQLPQLQTTLAVSDEKTGGGVKEWTAKQLDIKSPSEEAVRRQSKIEKRNARAAENRRRKREYSN